MPNAIIPAYVRRIVYVALAVAGLALGATQVGYSSIEATQPDWLTVALGVYAYLAGGSGILAVLNTPYELGGAPGEEPRRELID
ncbi:MAG: hypothetical protein V9F04_13725 [Dermatophilaceae bacterium]